MSIHVGEDKTGSILFSTKNRKRKIETLDIQYGDVKIKQYSKVIYLGCELDESLSWQATALKVVNKINGRLKFLYSKNRLGWKGGSIWPQLWFFKKLSSKGMVKPWFFVTFNIIISHIFPKIFNEIPQVVQKIWITSLSKLANFIDFHRFFGFSDISLLQKN